MALLVPGIREEYQDLIEGLTLKLVLQYLDGIVTDDAPVVHLCLLGAQQQPAHSRAMHLESQVAAARLGPRQTAHHLPDPEPDLQAARRPPSNNRFQAHA